MRLEEADQSGQQHGIAGSCPQLVCADSGQVDEPLSPAWNTKRCRKCGEGQRKPIIWLRGRHDLDKPLKG
jgi:hypothetical protein